MTDAEADILAKKQSEFKFIALCKENKDKHSYHTPFLSQAEIKKCNDRLKKLSKQDQLSILHREIKLKKVMFTEMPDDLVYFK